MIKQCNLKSFADLAVEHRIVNTPLFDSVNAIVDWQVIQRLITKYYQKGQSVEGRVRYDSLIVYKMLLFWSLNLFIRMSSIAL
jgi:hypothetical protein